ncbi:MAG: DNA repair exonuclease [Coriobacteriaceae bacterium]|jgi:DNA repair exonuclease SbcCD nuclease subunit|nr:DNA repair exonuclease [Coriobacteriaceae bacterium]
MAKQLTFIHAADLHLGAPFRGLQALSESWATRLLAAIPESYDRVIDAALKHEVDFVVIAGDIFDSARASYADYLHFFEGLKRLDSAGIPAYLCTGNHDPFTSWQQDFFALPPNTLMFPADKPGFALYEKEGETLAILGGRGYYNQSWPADKDIAEGISRQAAEEATGTKAPFAIGVLHTGLNLDPEKAPTEPGRLMQAGMDYWALGHIHLKYAYPPANPRLVFSGCIQGRDIKETGERGIYKVTLTEGLPNRLEFIPTASVVWQKMEVDVSECASLGEVSDKVLRDLFHENSKAQCEEMCTRIALVGKTELHTILDRPGILSDLRKALNDAYPVFFCDALLNKTTRPYDKEALREEGLFPAVFLQVCASFEGDCESTVLYLQDEFLKRSLQFPRACEKEVGQLASEAQELVLDLLGKVDA